MTNPEFTPRRVPRWPLLIVLIVLAAVVISGAFWSNRERDARLAAVGSTTTSTVANNGSAPLNANPSVTAGTVAPAATVTTNARQATACTAPVLLAAVKNSGQVDPSIISSTTVTAVVCAEPYARAHLTSAGADPVDAYLSNASGSWRLLTLGTAIDPGSIGIPRAAAEKLEP